MFFINTQLRNTHVAPLGLYPRSNNHRVGPSCMILGCLAAIFGLLLIGIGMISETEKTVFIGIGVINLGVGIFLTSFVCFHTKLGVYYNNWAYRSHTIPMHHDARQFAMKSATHSPEPPAATHVRPFPMPLTIVSNIGIGQTTLSSSSTSKKKANNPSNASQH